MSAIDEKSTKLRVGDRVRVTSGAHAGDEGKILRFSKDRSRVFVEGVNKVKRHEKPNQALGRAGGITEKEAAVDVSNVAIVCADGGVSRLAYRMLENGEKVRVARRTGEQL
jgi:large subunit ribosomal protein L24